MFVAQNVWCSKLVINWKTHNRSTIICYVSFVVVVTWLKLVAVYWWHSLVHSHTDHFLFVVDCCQSFFCFFLIFFSQTLFMFICFILFINFSSLSSLPILFFFSSFSLSLSLNYFVCVSTVNRFQYSIRFAYRCTGTRNQNIRQ